MNYDQAVGKACLACSPLGQGSLKRLFGQTEPYSHALQLPTLLLEVGSLSPSEYPPFSIVLASAAALSWADRYTFAAFLYLA
jgi:hypothetical protein